MINLNLKLKRNEQEDQMGTRQQTKLFRRHRF